MGLALTGLLATPGGERRAPAAIQTARTAQHGACEALVVVMGGEAWGIVFAPRRKRLPPWRKLRWVGLNKVRRRCCLEPAAPCTAPNAIATQCVPCTRPLRCRLAGLGGVGDGTSIATSRCLSAGREFAPCVSLSVCRTACRSSSCRDAGTRGDDASIGVRHEATTRSTGAQPPTAAYTGTVSCILTLPFSGGASRRLVRGFAIAKRNLESGKNSRH